MKLTSKPVLLGALFSSLFLIRAASPAYGEGERVLSMREFIDAAGSNNPAIFGELVKIKTAAAAVRQARAVYDIALAAHIGILYDEPFSKYSTIKILDQTTLNAGGGVQMIVPGAGTRINAGINYNQNRYRLGLPSSVPPFQTYQERVSIYNPEFFLELRQPLLKNWMGIIDGFPLKQADLERRIVSETVNEAVESIVIDLYNLYFDWYDAYNRYAIYKQNVVNTAELVNTVAVKFRTGLADTSDLSKARLNLLEANKARDFAATRLGNLHRKIVIWSTGKPVRADGPRFAPEKDIVLSFNPPPDFALDTTRQMKTLRISRMLFMSRLAAEKNGLLPELELSAGVRARGYAEHESASLNVGEYPNYSIGLSFSYPLQNNLAAGKLEEVKTLIKKWDDDMNDFERNYRQSIDEAVRVKDAYAVLLRQNDEILGQSAVLIREEEMKYRQGRSDLYYVIQYRNSRLNYEILHLTDRVDSLRITLQLMGLMDEIRK